MKYEKESNEWGLIRVRTGYWFTPSAMRFFKSKINWNTLTKIGESWYFISSEADWSGENRFYSIRKVTKAEPIWNVDTVGEFQAYGNLAEAKKALNEIKEESNV